MELKKGQSIGVIEKRLGFTDRSDSVSFENEDYVIRLCGVNKTPESYLYSGTARRVLAIIEETHEGFSIIKILDS